jgi:hypothetical protein
VHESYEKHVVKYGERNTSLDRIDVNGNYELQNIQWVTYKEQARNTRKSSKTKFYDVHLSWRKLLQYALRDVLKGRLKTSKHQKYFGCSIFELKQYIKSQFEPFMTWGNWGQGQDDWELDHIIGCNNFDFSKEEDRKKCFNYTNLRPMWRRKHIRKNTLRILETTV